MELKADTKIDELLKQYPFLMGFLISLSTKFENLKNPIMRKTVGKVATLSRAAAIGGLDLDDLISGLKNEIKKHTGETVSLDEPDAAGSEMPLRDSKERQEALKGIIRSLHSGEDMEVLKQRFRQLMHGVEAADIAKMEQARFAQQVIIDVVRAKSIVGTGTVEKNSVSVGRVEDDGIRTAFIHNIHIIDKVFAQIFDELQNNLAEHIIAYVAHEPGMDAQFMQRQPGIRNCPTR